MSPEPGPTDMRCTRLLNPRIHLTRGIRFQGSVGDGISVNPPLRRESRRVWGSNSRGPDCGREGGRKIGEVGERERVVVLSDQCCKG